MHQVTLAQAKKDLADLIDAALHGETVIIARDDTPVAQIVPVAPPSRRHFGSARGLIVMRDDFDAPIPDYSEYASRDCS